MVCQCLQWFMSFGGESWLIFPPYAANTDPSKLLFQSQSECWTQSVRKYIHAQTAPGIALVKLHTITHVKSEAITQAGVIVAGFNGQMQSVHYLACDFQSIAAPPRLFLVKFGVGRLDPRWVKGLGSRGNVLFFQFTWVSVPDSS